MVESGMVYQIALDGTTLALEGIRGYFQSRRAGLDAHLATRLATFLDDAHDSIDCAIYDLRHPRILDALARAAARGVRVRIAYDASKEHSGGMSADPKPSGTEAALADAGLLSFATPVHERGRHLMHDKFVLRDERDLWVGSANFTVGGLELQDNTCLAISSPDLVAHFAATFAALVQPQHRHMRSPVSLATVEAAEVVVGSTSILPLFAPAAGESIEQELIRAIRGGHKIRLMAFLLSDPGVLEALAPLARQPQFDIRGVYDPHGMEDVLRYTRQDPALFWFTHDPRFVAAPSHAFSAEREQDFMHNKTLVLDDQLVFTGSYNFSENAEANDEVMLKILSEPLAAAYAHYCDVLFATYGGVIEEPQTRRRLSGGPRFSGGPRVSGGPLPITSPRMPAITKPLPRTTAPRMPAITPPPAATSAASSAAPPIEEAPVGKPGSKSGSKSVNKPRGKPRRGLDILIFVVRLKIAVVIIAIIAYLVLSGIIHL